MSEENKDIRKEIAVGAAWVTMLRVLYRLIGLVSTVILARLLTPNDFGVAAIAMSIFALMNAFSKFGFETVIVQHKNPTYEHYSTAWTFNFLFGFFAAATLALSSGYIGEFYNNVDITYIAIVISSLFLLDGLKNTGIIDFQKNMDFDKEFKFYIVPKLICFFITLALAIYLRNFWALVIGNVILKLLEVVNSYLMHPLRPRFTFSKGGELFGFSKWLMVNNFLNFLNDKSPELVLGKIISPHSAAIYSISAEIGQMTTTEIVANLNRAIYPGYSKVSDNLSKLRNLYQDTIKVIALIAFPLGVGVALVSPYLVPIMLGPQWLDTIEPIVYLALGGTINAVRSNTNYVYFSLGKPRISTAELALKSIIFISFFAYLIEDGGALGVAKSFLYTAAIMFFISNIIVIYVLKISFMDQIKLYIKPALATIVMFISVSWTMTNIVIGNMVIDLILAVLSGVFSYVISVGLIWIATGKQAGVEKQIIGFCVNKLTHR
ncbi:MAG: lipopolysaccharide biosynthesis protein [Pseudomonadota bacterium]